MPSSIVDVDNSISEFIELNFAPTLGHVILIDSNSLVTAVNEVQDDVGNICLLYTSPSPRDVEESRMPSSA